MRLHFGTLTTFLLMVSCGLEPSQIPTSPAKSTILSADQEVDFGKDQAQEQNEDTVAPAADAKSDGSDKVEGLGQAEDNSDAGNQSGDSQLEDQEDEANEQAVVNNSSDDEDDLMGDDMNSDDDDDDKDSSQSNNSDNKNNSSNNNSSSQSADNDNNSNADDDEDSDKSMEMKTVFSPQDDMPAGFASCSGCHGEDGKGLGMFSTSIATSDFDEAYEVLRSGKGAMPEYDEDEVSLEVFAQIYVNISGKDLDLEEELPSSEL